MVINYSANQIKQFTFTINLCDLTIPIRVYPIFPVNHLVSFARFDLTARFGWKFFNGSERNCTNKECKLMIQSCPCYLYSTDKSNLHLEKFIRLELDQIK